MDGQSEDEDGERALPLTLSWRKRGETPDP
jgi:hypothetical protein